MKRILEQALDLLGKSINDPLFSRFSVNAAGAPKIVLDTGTIIVYRYEKVGINLHFMSGKNAKMPWSGFDRITFTKDYTGELPAGVRLGNLSRSGEKARAGTKPGNFRNFALFRTRL